MECKFRDHHHYYYYCCCCFLVFCCGGTDVELLVPFQKLVMQRGGTVFDEQQSSVHPCNLSGITCEGSTLLQLDLRCRESPTTLQFPAEIGRFRYLKSLNLSDCGLTGSIPGSIWNLRNLESLDLSGNKLSGTISPNISFPNLLKELILDDNDFSGTLPSAIGALNNLIELSVHKNAFTGSVPPEIGRLLNLKSLDLGMNFFSGNLPCSFGNLTHLRFLDVSHNTFTGPPICAKRGRRRRMLPEIEAVNFESSGFTGAITDELFELESLTYLNIAKNDLELSSLEGIGNLLNLTYFIAGNARLTGTIPVELSQCKKLRVLDLSFNSLSGSIPDSLSQLTFLESVLLDSNLLSGALPNWFSNWTNTAAIMLGKNFFTGTLPVFRMSSLYFLDLSANSLSGELPDEFCGAVSPSILLLSNNHFTGTLAGKFERCSELTDLVLSDNHLSGEIPGYLGRLNLTTLELSMNNFSGGLRDGLFESRTFLEVSLSYNLFSGEIPAAVISSLPNLQRLQLDNNLFTGSVPSSIGFLKNLTNLSLNGNNLTGEIPPEMMNCTKLVSLDLGYNRFTGSIPKTISNLRNLDNLVLSNNQLSGAIPVEICSGFGPGPLPESEFIQHYGTLDLSFNRFTGPIPASIKRCVNLTDLRLQNNRLTGDIRISGLENLAMIDLSFNDLIGPVTVSGLRSLQGLVLSHNRLAGSIPDRLDSLVPNLVKLDLSSNRLTGPVAPSVFRLTSLSVFNVSNNGLSGDLPDPFRMRALSVLDLRNNSLTGSLPLSLSTLASLTYLDLSENRFVRTVSPNICRIEGLQFVNFSANNFVGFVPESCVRAGDELRPKLRRSKIWEISLVCCCVTVVAAFLAAYVMKRGEKWRRSSSGSSVSSADGLLPEKTRRKRKEEPVSINVAIFQHSLQRVNPEEILSATENLSRSYVIGDGGFGTVYKAVLPGHHRAFAVKRLASGMDCSREFFAEMETLGKVKHENLVSLLGYCVFSNERFLVYEYMENGSLDVWLRNGATGGSTADPAAVLDWLTRFDVCLGTARGLAFLHHGFIPHIIHRDIKSSNILLDSQFRPKVADFGLARVISAWESHVSTVIAGTFGYIPPEYGQVMVATTRGDVYSFGVVMLELITGREPTGQPDNEGGNLVGWVRWMVGNGRVMEVPDPRISGSSSKWKVEMLRVLEIARCCTSDHPSKRPSMVEVVRLLLESRIP